jgi:hypothetical protein
MPSSVRRTFPAGSESEFKALSDTMIEPQCMVVKDYQRHHDRTTMYGGQRLSKTL